MQVVANKFPYEFWDNRPVVEHLLLIPKRHVLSLDELTLEEKSQAIHLMSQYESKDYSVYWRSQNNQTRTVPHQHTHLIKLQKKNTRFLLYVRRPYLLWKF
jgi:ATP adenylyltransferase